jgi:hypothetical protein
MGQTPPLEKRSDEELHQMLDKGSGIHRLRRIRIILSQRARERRHWLLAVVVGGLIVAVIAWLMAI